MEKLFVTNYIHMSYRSLYHLLVTELLWNLKDLGGSAQALFLPVREKNSKKRGHIIKVIARK